MRRSILSGASLLAAATLLSACSGFGIFLGDTTTFPGTNPNSPLGDSENLRRVRAEPVDLQPLQTEPGNVWPGPPAPLPTLEDIEKQENINPNSPPAQAAPTLPDHRQPTPIENGSSTPPPNVQPGLPASPNPGPANIPQVPFPSPRTGTAVQTPGGPPVFTTSPGTSVPGVTTTTPPGGSGGQGILIPNGNGTSTLIGPNGSVTTVPTPK
jgi:hypothetical protein